jgi:hypothetical protein
MKLSDLDGFDKLLHLISADNTIEPNLQGREIQAAGFRISPDCKDGMFIAPVGFPVGLQDIKSVDAGSVYDFDILPGGEIQFEIGYNQAEVPGYFSAEVAIVLLPTPDVLYEASGIIITFPRLKLISLEPGNMICQNSSDEEKWAWIYIF